GTYRCPVGYLPAKVGTYRWVVSYKSVGSDNTLTRPARQGRMSVTRAFRPGRGGPIHPPVHPPVRLVHYPPARRVISTPVHRTISTIVRKAVGKGALRHFITTNVSRVISLIVKRVVWFP